MGRRRHSSISFLTAIEAPTGSAAAGKGMLNVGPFPSNPPIPPSVVYAPRCIAARSHPLLHELEKQFLLSFVLFLWETVRPFLERQDKKYTREEV